MREYRVWRKVPGADQRTTQGHYVIANSRKEAIEKVRKKSERAYNFDAILWKQGKGWNLKLTKNAKCFKETGNICKR